MPKDVEILLDGERPRHLRYTIGAMRQLQKVSGMPLGRFAMDLRVASIEAYVQALTFGLQHELPTITTDQAAELLQMALDAGRPLKTIAEKINEAFIVSGLFEEAKNWQPAMETIPPPPE